MELVAIVFTAIILSANTAPAAEALQASAERLAFVTSEADNSLTIIDLITEKTIKTLPTGKTPHALVFTKTGKGYVNNRGSRDLTVINGNTLNIIKTIPLPAFSFQLAPSPDGNHFYMVNAEDNAMLKIDVAKMEVVSSIPVGKAAMYFAIKKGNDFPSTE